MVSPRQGLGTAILCTLPIWPHPWDSEVSHQVPLGAVLIPSVEHQLTGLWLLPDLISLRLALPHQSTVRLSTPGRQHQATPRGDIGQDWRSHPDPPVPSPNFGLLICKLFLVTVCPTQG